MVWTTLGSGGASHRSLSRYVASLLAAKSRSSRRAQIALFIARSSSFAYANNGFRSSARWPISSGLWPSATLRSWNPHPLRSMLIDVCVRQTSMASLGAGIPASIACAISITNAWRCILVPHMGKWSSTPSAKNPSKNSHENSHENSHTLENGLVPPCSILLFDIQSTLD